MRIITKTFLLLIIFAVTIESSTPRAAVDITDARREPLVVIRVDDVQDYAFRQGQLFLLWHSIANEIPLSLAVIVGDFGADKELFDAMTCLIHMGSEVTIHGWKHEDLAELTLIQQQEILLNGKMRLKEVLGVDATILVPPMFSYNDDTVTAMQTTGLKVISGLAELHGKGYVAQEVVSIPATVELSILENETWHIKTVDEVLEELDASIAAHGFAVIVTHPAEFIKDGALNEEATATYDELVRIIREWYSFTVLDGLKNRVLAG
jgi:peptidoglycan/xylan/chitin deacetylase (PgdA/CDA1 family)